MSEALTLQYIPLAQAKRWDRNPKRHDIGAICRSIELHGFRDPPAYDAALDAFVEGNGRTDALEALWQQKREPPRGIAVLDDGGWALPVIFGVDARSRAAAEAYGVDHNNLTLSGGDFTAWDMAKLWNQEEYTSLLSELAALDVMPVSVDGDDLDALLGGFVQEGAGGDDFDATPEDGPTRTQAGDLWVIGGVHRLIVGDSTDPATVARLMGGEKPFIMVTDPPYGVEYDPGWRNEAAAKGLIAFAPEREGKVANDERVDWQEAWALFSGDVVYCWHADRHASAVQASLERAGFEVRSQVIWAKPRFVISRGHYHWQHEPCWYAVRKGGTGHWTGDRSQTTLWEIGLRDETEQSDHGTQKPLECMARPIRNHGGEGDIVYDPFLGSGTTLIAAHRTGRRCYGIEIEPKYADVILRRAEAEGLTCERAE